MSGSGSHQSAPTRGRRHQPEITVEATARSFWKHAVGYGFARSDFVRFVNVLLSILISREESTESCATAPASVPHPVSGVKLTSHRELPLVGEHVTIRQFGEPDDRALLERWVAARAGHLFLLSMASGQLYDFERLLESAASRLGMIVHEGRTVGCVAYFDYNAEQRRAELRKVLGAPGLCRKDLESEAVKLWVGYGIGALGLKKIYLNRLASHIEDLSLDEEIGFCVEGILRNEVRIEGSYHDVLRLGLWHE